jgi:hypothetical protein
MMLIADRTNNVVLAATAFEQIKTAYETERSGGKQAYETERSGGKQKWAAYYEAQLPKAQAIRDRLKSK